MGCRLTARDSFVLVEDGAAYLKSTAFLKIVARLSGPWPVLTVGAIFPEGLRDQLYDLIARNRYRLFGRHQVLHGPDARG